MQVFRVAGLDRIDEIAEVIPAAVELLHQIALGIEGGPRRYSRSARRNLRCRRR